jgi:hypothetical protein
MRNSGDSLKKKYLALPTTLASERTSRSKWGRRSYIMPRGASPKREREYNELKEKFHEEGRYEGREEEVAARIVNKQRAEKGETKQQSSEKKSSGTKAKSSTNEAAKAGSKSSKKAGSKAGARKKPAT